jgi:hypothetical protein
VKFPPSTHGQVDHVFNFMYYLEVKNNNIHVQESVMSVIQHPKSQMDGNGGGCPKEERIHFVARAAQRRMAPSLA